MTEEETSFDPSLKKKKKKKKTPFDLEGALNEGETPGEARDTPEPAKDEMEDLDLENFGKKKKKKKKVAEDDDENNDEKEAKDDLDDLDLESFGKKKKKKKNISMKELEESLPDDKADDNEDVDLETFGKKKKKKKRPDAMADDADDNKENEGEGENTAWANHDRDYTYDELLQRVYNIIKDKNPDSVMGEKKKFVMRPPQVVKVGAKKTAFVNFTEISKMLHRQPKHLLAFLFAELGTTGAIDGNNQLVMKGKFQQKHIENVLRRYIKEYVTCHTCRSPDTILVKENRVFFLQCMTCHSRCSVQTIKTGFQAVTGKRSAIRAKQ